MKYVDFLLFLMLLSLLLLLSVAWPVQEQNLSSSSLSPSLFLSLNCTHLSVLSRPGLAWGLLRQLRTESGVVLLNVHQNHFCVSTKPQMYTSNVVGPINYICGRLDLKFESNSDLLQKLKVFNCQTDK